MRTRRPGRPRKFRNVWEMQEKIDGYFAECEEKCRPFTVQGLASYLGFASTHALRRYKTQSKARSHFRTTIERALLRIEVDKAQRLVACKNARLAQALVFDLKCNFGWREPTREIEISSKEGISAVLELSWEQWLERYKVECGQKEVGAAG